MTSLFSDKLKFKSQTFWFVTQERIIIISSSSSLYEYEEATAQQQAAAEWHHGDVARAQPMHAGVTVNLFPSETGSRLLSHSPGFQTKS